ncbi:DUF192 domain-containing protein [Thiobacter aerophilum]|uniref:DUF192 domain-containing protein n=1 Tax=Thiobacter aerophilum TaxID=3121275 RepID=A0ABV0EGK9_9BURK
MPRELLINGKVLRLHVADRFLARARGLLWRRLSREEGLLIVPCAAVHTFGMAYAIDAVFLDAQQRIRKIVAPLPPWRIAVCPSSRAVLELSAGQAEALGLEVGQSLTVLGEAGRP